MVNPTHFGVLRRNIYIYSCLIIFSLSLCTVNARPTLASRAIIRPIPMSGFKVTVLDDVTGATIPQVQASDGGGLIQGRVFSAPNVIWAIAAVTIGVPLGVAGVKLWRVTTALGGGLALAFAMWAALINTISESGLASSQSMSDMLILLITGAAFLVGMVGGAFRLIVLPAMAATCALGGSSIAVRGVILRPGLLVPPGQNQQLAFVNIVIVAAGALFGGLSVIFKQRESMIFSTSCIGSFLVALSVDLFLNGQNGMSRGLRSLFDMNDNHLADLVGDGYNPPLSSQIVVASSMGIASRIILCIIQHFVFPGPFQRPRPRDRTRSTIDSSIKDGSPSSQPPAGRTVVAPGPIWRTSVLSLFRVPGRSSSAGSTRQKIETGLSRSENSSNERRGSDAYNYGFGVYALPSELLRQQSQGRNQATSTSQINLQRPLTTVAPGPTPQFAGIGLRGYRDQYPAARNNTQTRNTAASPFAPSHYGNGQQVSAPEDSRGGYVRPGFPRNAPPQATSVPRARGITNPPVVNKSTVPRPQYPLPRTIPSSNTATATLALPINAVLGPSPRTGMGMSMLRMSIDSILDAYGGTSDTGYRYGGSRTGEGGRM
ncbi:unnamed protein product [Rhizoctonia solani]|uniref:TM7S3/TM198-like domain-containing protein n=1 Tax=Rhizoctonia solani TaxID=456999 RepID=A0A8H2WCE9_9AGAM|nr:unnamed protein product [Rhizoctonia solani]